MTDKIFNARIVSMTPMTNNIMQIVLTPQEYIPYQAGQYLNILVGKEELSFSIANASLGTNQYELHIRLNPQHANNEQLFQLLKAQAAIHIKLPFGTCNIDKIDAEKPIIFITGGTGFAQAKAFIEQLIANKDTRRFELYWGCRKQADLYMEELVKQWQSQVLNFSYYPIISDTKKDSLATKVIAMHKDIEQWQIILSGPFDMVYSARDVLIGHGLSEDNLYSDAFQFEKN